MKYKYVLNDAYKKKYAIPHFNFDSLQMAKFILEECNRLNSPVFISVSTSAVEYLGGYSVVKNIVESLKKELKISIPAILHLDHAKTLEECKIAIDNGFDSIMLDMSKHPLEENIKGILALREYKNDILIECEVGLIGKNGGEGISYAEVSACEEIIKESKADLLAPAIGTVHGLYKGEQNINIKRLKEINERIKVPLVLHGGSDTEKDTLKECIQNGICKINVNTALKRAWRESVKEYINDYPEELDYRKYIKHAEKYIKKCIMDHIIIFGSENKSG